MHIATSIAGPIIWTRFEPVEEEEWAAKDSATEEDESEGGFWVVFFTLRKEAVVRFVDDLELALEELGEQFSVSTVSAPRYVYVVASCTTTDLDFNSVDDAAEKAWMACMRLSHAYEADGCTLFAPKGFLSFDRQRAEALLSECLDLQVSHLK